MNQNPTYKASIPVFLKIEKRQVWNLKEHHHWSKQKSSFSVEQPEIIENVNNECCEYDSERQEKQ